jgi:hypothetical protein
VFTKEKMNVIGVQTQTIKSYCLDDVHGSKCLNAARLGRVLRSVGAPAGGPHARGAGSEKYNAR